MTTSITIKSTDTASIASLINAAASGSDAKFTPSLGEIGITVVNGELTATATDRYMGATYSSTASGEDASFRLTTAAAKFLTANVKKASQASEVEFVIDEEARRVTITHGASTFSDTWNTMKFPEILKLIDGWKPTEAAVPVTLKSEFLARLYKFTSAFTKVEYWNLELGLSEGNRDRPGAVRASSGSFRVIIMPNLKNA
jgi:DNA polymerase III sliding clamp (beta) subunit (PCNA family)